MNKEEIDEFLSYLGEVAYCNGGLLKDLNKENELELTFEFHKIVQNLPLST